MVRQLTLICAVFGALTLIPAVNHRASIVQADDWDDYWEDYEDAREDYLEDLREHDRRYWKRYRRDNDNRYWYGPRDRGYYYRAPGPIYYDPYGRSYGYPYYSRPGFSVNAGGIRFGLWR